MYLLKGSKSEHGDSREMIISRRDFLNRGYYSHLAQALSALADRYVEKNEVCYFDAGCGTGYYTEKVYSKLAETRNVALSGVDLSKDAVKICAKKMKYGEFAVASVYDLPIADSVFDIVTNVFSPQAEGEYARILKKGGVYLYALPAPRHLFAMKELLYENPYENEEKTVEYEGFRIVERVESSRDITLEKGDIESLFRMTPYFWRTSREGAERLLALDTLTLEASFYIYVFEKE